MKLLSYVYLFINPAGCADPSSQEEMAAASLDVNFKEELSAIEQCMSLCEFSLRICSDLYM